MILDREFFFDVATLLRTVFFACAILALPASVNAQLYGVTENERGLLPELCAYTQTQDFGDERFHAPSPGAIKMVEKYGPGHWHSHHYCWGLVKLMRANKSGKSAQDRKSLRQQAIGEFDYMINNVPKDFLLLADIWTRRGIALNQIGQSEQALKSFDRALAINSKFPAAHIEKLFLLQTINRTDVLGDAIAQADQAGISRERLIAAGIKIK
jgi:tetratricopeptide (TPR) repeat protein